MNDKPRSDWTPVDWRRFNHRGLAKSNLVAVSAGALSIAFCLVCKEVLIRHDNETEAETFVLDERTHDGFVDILLPQIVAYQAAVLLAAECCARGEEVSRDDQPVESTPSLMVTHRSLLAAIARFEERYRSHLKPKVGEIVETEPRQDP